MPLTDWFKRKRVKPVAATYLEDCFRIEFDELVDDRKWQDIPEARQIPETANSGQIDEARRLAQLLRAKHPDLDFPYFWLAVLYDIRHSNPPQFEKARAVLNEGLLVAKSKVSLCRLRGDIEYQSRDLAAAAKWWTKCAVLQAKHRRVDDTPFLYLYYTASMLGMDAASMRLRLWVDRITPGGLALDDQEQSNLRQLVGLLSDSESLKAAIDVLVDEHLPLASLGTSMESEEITECIRLQEAGDYASVLATVFGVLLSAPWDYEARKLAFSSLKDGSSTISRQHLGHAAFDQFFCSCDRCRAAWVSPRAVMTAVLGSMAGYSVANPLGIYCSKCRGTFCRKCYVVTAPAGVVVCPNCGSDEVASPGVPNGRKRL